MLIKHSNLSINLSIFFHQSIAWIRQGYSENIYIKRPLRIYGIWFTYPYTICKDCPRKQKASFLVPYDNMLNVIFSIYLDIQRRKNHSFSNLSRIHPHYSHFLLIAINTGHNFISERPFYKVWLVPSTVVWLWYHIK